MMQYDERNGWRLYLHPAFKKPWLELIDAVDKIQNRDPNGAINHPKAKLLKRITDLILDEIPQQPDAPQFELGNTLGPIHRHWRRAKFLRRFRLFFRFHSQAKVIIYAWVNDEKTQRKAGSKTDPYAVFKKRLLRGNPPDNWDALLRAADEPE